LTKGLPDTQGHTLCKDERLRGKRTISGLFDSGKFFCVAPYRIVWTKVAIADACPSKFAVSVPKRRFKRAVKRNLLKRRTREAFRINKQLLNVSIEDGQQIRMMLIYMFDKILPFNELEIAMKQILQRIAQKHASN
jgi:ribonuclease P protein component